MRALTYVEIDISRCSLTYGSAPCTAAIPTTGSKKCFNSKATCQDRTNYAETTVTMRFSLTGVSYAPSDIPSLPVITSVQHNPGAISLGEDLGERSSVTVSFKDFRDSDTGPYGDKYLSDRSYNPFTQGTFFGRFRTRHKYLRGQSLRLIRGFLGDSLGAMDTRHYIIDSFTGPDASGNFTIVARDALKLADNERAKAPRVSEGRLSADITNVATSLTLTPSGIGDAYYPTSGHLVLGGKEVVSFTRTPARDTYMKLLLHMNGADASTTFTNSSSFSHTVTPAGNAQIDTAQSKFGGASALFDGTDDYLSLDGSSDFAFGTGDFTIAMWFRLAAIGSERMLYDSSPSGTSGSYPSIYIGTNNILQALVNYTPVAVSRTVLAANTWYHVAVTREDGLWRIFINGVFEGAGYNSTSLLNGASRPVIGTNGAFPTLQEMNGWIDEVEVSKGIARYTHSFNVPTTEIAASGGDTVTITRAQLNTTADAHKQDDRVQELLSFVSRDPAYIIEELMVNYAGIDPAYIDITAWLAETTAYLNRLYTARIAEPTGVRQLISELVEQAALAIWWDDAQQKVRLQVLRSVPTTAALFDEHNILEGTTGITEQPDKRISEVWTFFDMRNPCEPLEDRNFKSVAVSVDLQRESDYGSSAIKKIMSRWIPNGGRAVALRLNEVQLARYKDPPRAFAFSVMRGTAIEMGGGYRLGSWAVQDDEGAAVYAEMQVTRLSREDSRISVAAEEVLFDIPASDLNARTIILDTNQNNVNIQTLHDSLYPPITTVGAITLTVIVDTGVVIGSTSTSSPAMNIGSFTVGLPITVQVKGRIQGAGGAGGAGTTVNVNGGTGGAGGTALYTRQALTLDVSSGSGEVWGGGGGGGGGTGSAVGGTGGGGGGAGTVVGLKGGNFNGGINAADGTATAGGAGGTGSANGGAGGGPGLAGGNGTRSNGTGAVGVGGAAGNQVDGISYVTVTGTGDRRGATVN